MNWKIVKETKKSWWRDYYFYATAEQHGQMFELECSLEQCFYIIFIYKNGRKESDIILAVTVDKDDYPEKFIHQIMRITDSDINKKTMEIDRRIKDGALSTSHYRRDVLSRTNN